MVLRGFASQRRVPRLFSKRLLLSNPRNSFCCPRQSTFTTSIPTCDEKSVATRAEFIGAAAVDKYYANAKNLTYAALDSRKPPTQISLPEFSKKYRAGLQDAESKPDEIYTVQGRVLNFRVQSNKLVFYDIVSDNIKLQVVYSFNSMEERFQKIDDFASIHNLVRRGDIVSVTGYPAKTSKGTVSLKATAWIKILTPTLNIVPVEDNLRPETAAAVPRHVQLFKNPEAQDILRLRSIVMSNIRSFFLDRNFVEVQTPILSPREGGASAEPFVTTLGASENKLYLRVAPELWLKRMIVGGMTRIFELGPSFRNEGVDYTHNPEFTTCEFYQAYTVLTEVMETTRSLITRLLNATKIARQQALFHLPHLDSRAESAFENSMDRGFFRTIDFIRGIESAANIKLPKLDEPDAAEHVFDIMKNNLQLYILRDKEFVNEARTLPWLLDKLASIYIEPDIVSPTWIINQPACLSPLAKTYTRSVDSQKISVRAELFMLGTEICNCYEEENSPFEQRKKFEEQLYWRCMAEGIDESTQPEKYQELRNSIVDEAYISALNWGMPPTAGWGLGVDRICMMLGGTSKIGDVLSFGNVDSVRRAALASENVLKVGANWADERYKAIQETRDLKKKQLALLGPEIDNPTFKAHAKEVLSNLDAEKGSY